MKFAEDQLFVCGDEGGGVAGYVRRRGELITWFQPGGRSRAFTVREVLEDGDDRFAFIDERGRRFELRALTLRDYNERVRREQDPALTTEAELLEAFRRSQA